MKSFHGLRLCFLAEAKIVCIVFLYTRLTYMHMDPLGGQIRTSEPALQLAAME